MPNYEYSSRNNIFVLIATRSLYHSSKDDDDDVSLALSLSLVFARESDAFRCRVPTVLLIQALRSAVGVEAGIAHLMFPLLWVKFTRLPGLPHLYRDRLKSFS